MKKFFIVIITLVVLAFAGLFAVAKLAPMDKIQQAVKVQAKEKTGRDLAFSDAKITFWPSLGVELHDVSFSNAPWASEKNMITLNTLDVRLAVMPLLKKQVIVEKFVLQNPMIHLEIAADGRQNWVFKNTTEAASGTVSEEKSSAMAKDMQVQFGNLEIEKGTLSYIDRQKGTNEKLENVDITVSLPDLDSALNIDGTADYKSKRVTLSLSLTKPKALVDGKVSAGTLKLRAPDLRADISGMFATSGQMLEKGKIDADIPSLSSLVSWLSGKTAGPKPFEKISFVSDASYAKSILSLQNADLKMDDVEAKGDVKLSLGSTKPNIYARLSLNKLNLDRFVNAEGAEAKPAGAKTTSDNGWDTTPIDFSGLKSVDADLVLKTNGFSLKGAEVGASTLTAVLKNGALTASSSKASFFDGAFSADLSLNATPTTPTMAFKFKMDGVKSKPVLTTFANFKKLSGPVDANIDVTSMGNTQKSIISNLNGNGSVLFKNGALEGIDLVNIAKKVQDKLTNMGVGEGKTDFVNLGGTFSIAKGVATNNDLKMSGPLVQAKGEGKIDLPQKFIRYRVIPTLTASSGVEGAGGFQVPVDIKGNFNDIKVRPDYSAVIKNVLNNPDQIDNTLKGVKEQGKAIEDNLRQLKENPAEALGNFLGGGFGKKQPAPAPVETAPAPTPEISPAPAE